MLGHEHRVEHAEGGEHGYQQCQQPEVGRCESHGSRVPGQGVHDGAVPEGPGQRANLGAGGNARLDSDVVVVGGQPGGGAAAGP